MVGRRACPRPYEDPVVDGVERGCGRLLAGIAPEITRHATASNEQSAVLVSPRDQQSAADSMCATEQAVTMEVAGEQASVVARPSAYAGPAGEMGAHQSPNGPLGPRDSLVDVSIIVVNWNTVDLLRACLTSLVQQASSSRCEIIVVDNGSRDGSVHMVAQHFPRVRLVTNARNRGFAAANNQGLSQARGHYILLLNTDTLVLPGALEEMVRYMDMHARTGALGPRLLNEDRSLQISAYPFPRVFHDALVILEINRWPLVGTVARRYGRRRDSRMSAQAGEVDWVMGACLLLRRESLEDVGVLNDDYFFGTEEMDLCYRLRRRGWSTAYLPSAEVVHFGGRSREHVSATHLIWMYTGRLQYYRLHHSRWHCLILRGAIALAALGHIAWLLRAQRSSRHRPLLSAYAHVLARAVAP